MDPILTGAAANLSSDVAKGIFQEAKLHIRRVFSYQKNLEKFQKKMELLIAKRQSVQQEVDAADRNVEKIKADVELWCKTVDNVTKEEEEKVKDLEDKARSKCFIGLCPNIISRYQLSKKVEEVAPTVDELLQQGNFDRVAYRDKVELFQQGAPSKDFTVIDSRREVFDGIMEALKDSTASVIGVYGTGGVGKTTLVNEVIRHVQEVKLFGSVVKATVTETPSIEKIQDEIAESLCLELKEKSIQVRAGRLRERLKKEKNVLVVLDDVWARLDLKDVGIPSGDQQERQDLKEAGIPSRDQQERQDLKEAGIPFGDQQERCKILLTSRNRGVLTNQMDAQKAFEISVVEEKEAWDLFKKTIRDDFEDPELRSVANQVARKCAGLPLAIVTVARALRNHRDLPVWNDALLQLQRPSPSNFTGIPAAVYSAIELSYKHLESEDLKQTFLLCSQLGHNASIQDLVRYTMGLHLFDNVKTVEETRNRVLTMVSNLKASCLLHDSYSNKRFDMHDFVCDVALAIASRDNHAFAWKGDGVFDDWPDKEKMRELKMINLCFGSVKKLPPQLECPQVTFFCMGGNDSYVEMPTNFFEKTENIQVLDLSDIDFSSSSSSIILPTSLRTLCLDRCVVGGMANLGKLENLEILSLSGSDIEILPKEIEQLTRLRLLDLRSCTKLRVIPFGVVSSLCRLEELYMSKSFVRWNQGSNARVDELKDLTCLTTLEVQILDAKIVPKGFFSDRWQRYQIVIGDGWDWVGKNEYSRTLKLELNTGIVSRGWMIGMGSDVYWRKQKLYM